MVLSARLLARRFHGTRFATQPGRFELAAGIAWPGTANRLFLNALRVVFHRLRG